MKSQIENEEFVSADELSQLMQRRITTYDLLSKLFIKEVDEAQLKALNSAMFPSGTKSYEINKGYSMMVEYLSKIHPDVITELAVDYVRLFIGTGIDAKSAAYPFESVYTSEHSNIMQEARDEVLVIYRSCGLDKVDAWKEGEDHIGIELEFMSFLSQEAKKAIDSDNEEIAFSHMVTQKNFLDKHLLNWVGEFCEQIRKIGKTQFYIGLSYLLEGFLKSDILLINEIIGQEQ